MARYDDMRILRREEFMPLEEMLRVTEVSNGILRARLL
jgi:hypothetical protein